MELSYWELKTWLSEIDFCIVGSGITGLSCALSLSESYPEARILILEKGIFPQGASTKNAGFACFGSLTEILSDLQAHTEDEIVQLVSDRWRGIQLLRKRLGDSGIDYKGWGGYEVFLREEDALYQHCMEQMERINQLLFPVFGKPCFQMTANTFGFKGTLPKLILSSEEGQIDTGRMMQALLDRVQRRVNPVRILNGITLGGYEDLGGRVLLKTDQFEFYCRKLLLATNGFAASLGDLAVKPARAQVLVTNPIEGLKVKGTFHMDAGYYYFRNIGERILLGGGRNLDTEGETTTEFGQTEVIQNRLESLLKEVILPGKEFRIEQRWSGIMGVGPQKKPILKKLSPNVACGVRLGGMGVAIGSHTGAELARLGSQ
ncbi:MAG: NAD(P)/FAD-dependent oxidoreductase [Robiginitalea sp.]|jgi:glycine/D-amino acid oxidase-like deaminating enzyme